MYLLFACATEAVNRLELDPEVSEKMPMDKEKK